MINPVHFRAAGNGNYGCVRAAIAGNYTSNPERVTCIHCKAYLVEVALRPPTKKCSNCGGNGLPGGRSFLGFGGERCSACNGTGLVPA